MSRITGYGQEDLWQRQLLKAKKASNNGKAAGTSAVGNSSEAGGASCSSDASAANGSFSSSGIYITPKDTVVSSEDALAILEGNDGNVNTDSKSFQEIYDEMCANVPDKTSTVEEKEKALEYIDKMLNSNDITPELKSYWENIKAIIQNEIKTIENEQKAAQSEKTENFRDVFDEMGQKVPDSTSTVEEKELAISYINRMLSCDDIPNPEYWENKRTIIQNEIQTIKNEEAIGSDKDFESLEKEFWDYSNNVWNKEVNFENTPDRVEYWQSYYNTCISYLDRLLNCEGITNEQYQEYTRMKQNMQADKNYHQRDLNRYYNENGNITESFSKVFSEFNRNVPDITTTVDEKQLALSYIERMLSCEDIPNGIKSYWTNQKRIIQQEIDNF